PRRAVGEHLVAGLVLVESAAERRVRCVKCGVRFKFERQDPAAVGRHAADAQFVVGKAIPQARGADGDGAAGRAEWQRGRRRAGGCRNRRALHVEKQRQGAQRRHGQVRLLHDQCPRLHARRRVSERERERHPSPDGGGHRPRQPDEQPIGVRVLKAQPREEHRLRPVEQQRALFSADQGEGRVVDVGTGQAGSHAQRQPAANIRDRVRTDLQGRPTHAQFGPLAHEAVRGQPLHGEWRAGPDVRCPRSIRLGIARHPQLTARDLDERRRGRRVGRAPVGEAVGKAAVADLVGVAADSGQRQGHHAPPRSDRRRVVHLDQRRPRRVGREEDARADAQPRRARQLYRAVAGPRVQDLLVDAAAVPHVRALPLRVDQNRRAAGIVRVAELDPPTGQYTRHLPPRRGDGRPVAVAVRIPERDHHRGQLLFVYRESQTGLVPRLRDAQGRHRAAPPRPAVQRPHRVAGADDLHLQLRLVEQVEKEGRRRWRIQLELHDGVLFHLAEHHPQPRRRAVGHDIRGQRRDHIELPRHARRHPTGHYAQDGPAAGEIGKDGREGKVRGRTGVRGLHLRNAPLDDRPVGPHHPHHHAHVAAEVEPPLPADGQRGGFVPVEAGAFCPLHEHQRPEPLATGRAVVGPEGDVHRTLPPSSMAAVFARWPSWRSMRSREGEARRAPPSLRRPRISARISRCTASCEAE
ncbi:MAG: hypothetical protein ACK5QX_08055, partial [bacterium]